MNNNTLEDMHIEHKNEIANKIADITSMLDWLGSRDVLSYDVTATDAKGNVFTFGIDGGIAEQSTRGLINSLVLRLKELETSYFLNR